MENNDIAKKIVDKILKYDNKKKLSWTGTYKEILKELNMENEISNDALLINVIKRITSLGYDIVSEPFALINFR